MVWQTFPVMGHLVNVFGFTRQEVSIISFTITQLCGCSVKVAIDNQKQMGMTVF